MFALRIWSRSLSAATCLCSTLALAQVAPQEPTKTSPATPAPITVVTPEGGAADSNNISFFLANQNPGAGGTLALYADPAAALAEPGKFWIGLLCVDAGEALRQQLGLEAEVGLVVESVTDEAPAKKAGFQKNDVLLSVTLPSDDPKVEPTPLKGIMSLVELVQKAEAKPLKVTLLRRGQKQTIEVTPAERPQAPIAVQVKRFGPAEQQLQAILEAQRKQADGQANQPYRAWTNLRMAGPMFVPQPPQAPKLPEGMTVEFRQVVGQPERVLVSKGDQKWEAPTDDLCKLPADVRRPVEQQIAFRRGAAMMPGMMGFSTLQPDGGFGVIGAGQPAAGAVPATVHVESHATSSLPEGMSVSVTKSGSEPARIVVKKGDQTWEVTDKELDKLPPDVRKAVDAAIAPGVGTRFTNAWSGRTPNDQRVRQLYDALRLENQGRPQAGTPTSPNNQLQERQEAMLKQLQQLTEKVEKLQQALEKSTPKP